MWARLFFCFVEMHKGETSRGDTAIVDASRKPEAEAEREPEAGSRKPEAEDIIVRICPPPRINAYSSNFPVKP
jgi:hypothetical protein